MDLSTQLNKAYRMLPKMAKKDRSLANIKQKPR